MNWMKRLASAAGWDLFGASPAACILLFPNGLADSWESRLAVYVMPFVVVAATVMFVIWRGHRTDLGTLTRELAQARSLLEQREHERDLTQEELFRRLYKERELNKERPSSSRNWPSTRSTRR